MKIKPVDLIASWNALSSLIEVNEDPQFIAQCKRVGFQISDEIEFWNSLSEAERKSIANEQMEIQITKITKVPEVYANLQREAASRFFDVELPERILKMKELLEADESER